MEDDGSDPALPRAPLYTHAHAHAREETLGNFRLFGRKRKAKIRADWRIWKSVLSGCWSIQGTSPYPVYVDPALPRAPLYTHPHAHAREETLGNFRLFGRKRKAKIRADWRIWKSVLSGCWSIQGTSPYPVYVTSSKRWNPAIRIRGRGGVREALML